MPLLPDHNSHMCIEQDISFRSALSISSFVFFACLISRIFSASQQCFSLTVNQSKVISAMFYIFRHDIYLNV